MIQPSRVSARTCHHRSVAVIALLLIAASVSAQTPRDTPVQSDSVDVRLVDVDLRTAAQALGRYLDRPIVIGNTLPPNRVTLETPHRIARRDVLPLLRGMLEGQNVELVEDTVAHLYRLKGKAVAAVRSPSLPSATGMSQVPDLHAIRLKHAKAADVAAVVNALYGRASAIGEIGERPGPVLSRALEQGAVPTNAAQPPMSVGNAARGATISGDVVIVPDPRGNALLVRANPNDFALIKAAVDEVDVRPLQVLVEVLIAEVQKDRMIDFGLDAKLPPTSVRGNPRVSAEGASAGGGIGDFVLKVMHMGGADVEATIRLAASRGDARIVSRPVLVAANNEKAEINVGSQRPFVQVSRVLPTDNAARDQVVQYKDVGTRLSLLPTISADGYVMLQLVQEVNVATAEQQFDAPIISTRSLDTKILIHDGQTIVLGGLTDRQWERTQEGVPILSNIPWVGGLFGHLGHRTSETELLLFVTPRIIRDDRSADSLSAPLLQRADTISHR